MEKGVRSARGAIVNFDLLKIKEQMASAPKPVVVEARENFIDNRFKRQLKKQVREAINMAADDIISLDSAPTETQTTEPEPPVVKSKNKQSTIVEDNNADQSNS